MFKRQASRKAAIFCATLVFGSMHISAASSVDYGIIIKKKDISATATFITYSYKGLKMEIIAVKASDGTIRTALNTCQVCYQSGRGYYKQAGDVFVCQNCGNRFRIDQAEKIKGG